MTKTKWTAEQIQAAKNYHRTRWEAKQREQEAYRIKALQAAEKVIPQILAQYPSVSAGYLFGSILRPNAFGENSDIDLAVTDLAPEAYASLWTDLEQALPLWAIDLRPLPDEGLFTEMVYRTGKKIYERRITASKS